MAVAAKFVATRKSSDVPTYEEIVARDANPQ